MADSINIGTGAGGGTGSVEDLEIQANRSQQIQVALHRIGQKAGEVSAWIEAMKKLNESKEKAVASTFTTAARVVT